MSLTVISRENSRSLFYTSEKWLQATQRHYQMFFFTSFTFSHHTYMYMLMVVQCSMMLTYHKVLIHVECTLLI